MLAAIRDMKRLFADLSLLLRSADEPFKKYGWLPVQKNANVATTDNSAAVYAPERWMPYYAFRYFESKDRPHAFAYVSVLLDDLDNPDRLSEPLGSAGIVQHGEGGHGWSYWYARAALFVPGVPQDGRRVEVDVKPFDREFVAKAEVLALPLVEVPDAQAVATKLLAPLFGSEGEQA
jgi:hypothetical protein